MYIDEAAPIDLDPSVTSYTLKKLVQGSHVFVQLVAVGPQGQSAPASTSIDVPAAPTGSHPPTVAKTRTAHVPTTTQPAASTQSSAGGPSSRPTNAGSAGELRVRGLVRWLTFGTSKCEGWRTVDDLVHVADGSGNVLAVATVTTKTTDADSVGAVCNYFYEAVIPSGSPVYKFSLTVDKEELSPIGRTLEKTVPASSVASGNGPTFNITDAY